MNLADLKTALAAHPDAALAVRLPGGRGIPPHFHVTEVGHVTRRFVDCGGDEHRLETCLLQAWVADDLDHRLTAGKLARILDLFDKLSEDDTLPVEVEYEAGLISQYPVASIDAEDGTVTIHLMTRHTDCLAKEACGLTAASEPDCCSSGCC